MIYGIIINGYCVGRDMVRNGCGILRGTKAYRYAGISLETHTTPCTSSSSSNGATAQCGLWPVAQ